MPISKKCELIFVHIPKNAGTSIEKTFDMNLMHGHFSWYSYKLRYKDEWKNFLKFSVIRNPYERTVSNYLYAKRKISYHHNNLNPLKAKHGRHPDYEILKDKSFFEAVLIIDELNHQGWNPQYQYICDDEGNIMVDELLRMENLPDNFHKMIEKYDLPRRELKCLNTTSNYNWEDFYNTESIKIVSDYYELDFELFNYEMKNEGL